MTEGSRRRSNPRRPHPAVSSTRQSCVEFTLPGEAVVLPGDKGRQFPAGQGLNSCLSPA